MIKNWYVYILRCKGNFLYVGRTTNYKKRLKEHNQGRGSLYTKNKIPVKIIYLEEFNSLYKAYKREFQIKGWSRKKKYNLIKFGRPLV